MPDLGSGVAGGARGWVAGRAGLWGVPRPGFGLLVPVPSSLSTQPPFPTQALNSKLLKTSYRYVIFTSNLQTHLTRFFSCIRALENNCDLCVFGNVAGQIEPSGKFVSKPGNFVST